MHDDSCDITPLLMSFLLSEGPDVRGTVSVGHVGMIVGDVTDSSGVAASMWDVALFFEVSCPVAEQALVDVHTLVCEVAMSLAPEAVRVIFVGPVLPPVCEVVEPHVEYGLGNICSCWGIVEDTWLEAAEGIGSGQGA
jgi:hypothetical protein